MNVDIAYMDDLEVNQKLHKTHKWFLGLKLNKGVSGVNLIGVWLMNFFSFLQ